MATQTTNYGLTKDAVTDYYNINTTNANLDIIDATLGNSAKFEKAAGTATAITLTGIALEDGKAKNFIVSADNNGMDTKINGKPLYKPGTTTVPKLIAGKAITIWYDATGNCFFIKASAEGNASAEHVLAGDTFSTDSDIGLVGTMPMAPNYPLNNSSVVFDVYDDKAYANGVHNSFMKVPKGYYNDTWIGMNMPTLNKDNLKAGVQIGSNNKITGIFTADATAVDANVLTGKTYYRNGVKGTGNIPVAGTFTQATDYHQYPNNSVDGAHNMFVQPPKGYYDGSVWVAVNEPDLIPTNVRVGVTIGQGMGFTGTLVEVKELYDFPLSIQTTQPTAIRTGHIWVNSALGTSISTVKIVEAINAGEANGTLMLVVAPTEYRNFSTTHKKTLTDDTTKSFSIADTNTTNDWLVQAITGGITSTTYLGKPMVYSKIGGVLDVETAYMWNGSGWILLSQKGQYIAVRQTYSTTNNYVRIHNIIGDTVIAQSTINLTGASYATTRIQFSADGTYMLAGNAVYRRIGDVFSLYYTIPDITATTVPNNTNVGIEDMVMSKDGSTIAVVYNKIATYTYCCLRIYGNNGSTFTLLSSTDVSGYGMSGNVAINNSGSLIIYSYPITQVSSDTYKYMALKGFFRNASGGYNPGVDINTGHNVWAYSDYLLGYSYKMNFLEDDRYFYGTFKGGQTSTVYGISVLIDYANKTTSVIDANITTTTLNSAYNIQALSYAGSIGSLLILKYSVYYIAYDIVNKVLYSISVTGSNISLDYARSLVFNVNNDRAYAVAGISSKGNVFSVALNTTANTLVLTKIAEFTLPNGGSSSWTADCDVCPN